MDVEKFVEACLELGAKKAFSGAAGTVQDIEEVLAECEKEKRKLVQKLAGLEGLLDMVTSQADKAVRRAERAARQAEEDRKRLLVISQEMPALLNSFTGLGNWTYTTNCSMYEFSSEMEITKYAPRSIFLSSYWGDKTDVYEWRDDGEMVLAVTKAITEALGLEEARHYHQPPTHERGKQ